ncbi:MAG: plasmid replication initiator TrfA [Candidatus Tectimicrobiota bacterium]
MAELEEKVAQMQAKSIQKNTAKTTTKVVQLPLWPEPVRAVPNGFLRSALFGAIAKGKRRYMDRERIASVDSVEILSTGQRLDQGDLDTYESVLHAVRFQAMGEQCRITSYALLKLMGKTDAGSNRATLHKRIIRLRSHTVEIKQGRYSYIGGLIEEAYKDEETQEWIIALNPKLRALFAADQFTQIEWAVRHELDGHQLAQWLHGFYASHAAPLPMKVETLLKLAGSENDNPSSGRQKLRKALDAVAAASAASGQPFSYEIRADLVHVDKQGSASQQRHLKRKPKPRKPEA